MLVVIQFIVLLVVKAIQSLILKEMVYLENLTILVEPLIPSLAVRIIL